MGLVGLVAVPLVASADELSDLKVQVQALMQRIEALENQVQEQASAPTSAPAKMASSGNEAIKLEVSGQVNRALLVADDGDRSRLFHVDNDNSSTRVRWHGTGQFNDDLTAGALIEVQFESNSSSGVDIDQDGEVGTNSFTQRHLTLFLDSKALGRLWVGQGATASNGTSEVDLSGTSVINYAGIGDLAGGLSFKK